MNCQEINFLLDANSTEGLGMGRKRTLAQHFESCQGCREAWAAYREVSALRIPETPQGLRSRIMAEVAPNGSRAPRSLIIGGVLAVGAAVAAAVALRVAEDMSEVAWHLEEPLRIVPPGLQARQERVPGSTHRVDVAASAETPSEASGSTSSRSEHALDPNTIVIVPVPNPDLVPGRVAQFARFHEEILRRLQAVPGLNVARPELVDPFLGSGIPEEQVARDLGAGHLVVLSTMSEPSAWLTVTAVDMATGAATGSTALQPPFDSRWPAELASDAASVADFIKEGLTRYTPAQRQAAIADARAVVLNAALPAAERVEALGKLPQTPEARTDAVVAAAVELAALAPGLRVSGVRCTALRIHT